jgi:hypothetical protein
MPLVRIPTTGAELVASAQVVRRRTITVAAGAAITPLPALQLQINNLPNIFIWMEQTAGANGIAFSPYFAVDNINVAGAVQPNWLQLAPSSAIALGVPTFFNLRIVGNMITLGIDNPTLSAATLQVVVGASQ